jgi:glycosyltransferase involved in cell wall biosynthesis
MDPVAASGGGLTVLPDDPEALAEALVTVATMSPAERSAMGTAGHDFVRREHDLRTLGAEFARLVGCRVDEA